jgi:hypothetical protein
MYKDIQKIYDEADKVKRRSYPCLLVDEENMYYPKGATMYYAHTAYKPLEGWMGCKWCKKRRKCVEDYEPPKQPKRLLRRRV